MIKKQVLVLTLKFYHPSCQTMNKTAVIYALRMMTAITWQPKNKFKKMEYNTYANFTVKLVQFQVV